MPKQGGTTSRIVVEDLRQFYHLPISETANRLGICITQLKRICRKLGIKKWPHRQIRSLKRSIQKLNNSAKDSSGIERQRFLAESKVLELKMQYIVSSVGNSVSSNDDDADHLESTTSEYIEKAQQCFNSYNGKDTTNTYERPASQLSAESISLHESTASSTCSSSLGSNHSRQFGSDNSSEGHSPNYSDDEQFDEGMNRRLQSSCPCNNPGSNPIQRLPNGHNMNSTTIPQLLYRNNEMELDQDYNRIQQIRLYQIQRESSRELVSASTSMNQHYVNVYIEDTPRSYCQQELNLPSTYSVPLSQRYEEVEILSLLQQRRTSGSTTKNNIVSILN